MNTGYPTNLTDKQWQVIEKVINPQERARKHSLRDIMPPSFSNDAFRSAYICHIVLQFAKTPMPFATSLLRVSTL